MYRLMFWAENSSGDIWNKPQVSYHNDKNTALEQYKEVVDFYKNSCYGNVLHAIQLEEVNVIKQEKDDYIAHYQPWYKENL